MTDQLTRRTTITGAASAALALPLLAACGSSGSADQDGAASDPAGNPSGGASSDSSAGGSSAAAGGSGTPLAKTSEIQVGGGKIFSDEKVVVTQPSAGQFKAFSSTCTHMGCQVAAVSDGTIDCPCHGSRFSIADGSVQGGPAPAPLPAMDITVTGGEIMLES